MSDKFINPYTFVALPENGAVRSNPADCGDPVFSGEIECTLKTMTQIVVPDELKNPFASEDNRTEPKEYDFFRVNETAVIPGSGIRGVIRSVFETLTDSCMRLNDTDDDYFHTRVNKTTPAIIEYDGKNYILYEAERLRDKEDRGFYEDDYYSGKQIGNIGALPGKNSRIVDWSGGKLSGVYHRVNQFRGGGKPSHPSVFIKRSGDGTVLEKVYVDRLLKNIIMYKGAYRSEYKGAFDNMKNGGQLPVWYYRDERTGHYYFAPSQNSRAVFVNQPKDFVERAKVKRCSSGEICEACALFGFIGEESRASRVRFTDALCKTPDPFDGSYILPILATPRLSSFEFYLDGNGLKKFGADTEGVKLRGRKFYWHQPNARISSDDDSAKRQPKMSAKMELVKAGVEFKFSVFFDRITDNQLKKLIFALNLGSNDSRFCHKLGHGKPIGLGSAKITADKISKRSFKDGVYSVEDVTEQIISEVRRGLFRESRELDAFLEKVLDFEAVGENTVDYPRLAAGGAIFKWFAANREGLKDKGYIGVKHPLPKITDNDQTLKRSFDDSKKSGGNNNKYRGRK